MSESRKSRVNDGEKKRKTGMKMNKVILIESDTSKANNIEYFTWASCRLVSNIR